MQRRSWATLAARREVRRGSRFRTLRLEFLETRATPATFMVLNANDSGPGSLRAAIISANADVDPDTITFSTDAFASPQTITLTTAAIPGEVGLPPLSHNVTILGPGADKLTITRQTGPAGPGDFRLLEVNPDILATISGLTFTNPTPEDADAAFNGAVLNRGSLTLQGTAFTGNVANFYGGAIFNSIDQGPATLTLLDSTFSANASLMSDGGAVFNAGGTVVAINSTFSGNTAGSYGGALATFGGSVTVTNCTVTGNHAFVEGGGIDTFEASTKLVNTLVAGNTSTNANAPNDLGSDPVQPTSHHNLIGAAGSAGGLVNGVNSNLVGINGTGTRPIQAILSPALANNGGPTKTHTLVPGSPAVNAGSNPAAADLFSDQRGGGYERIVGSAVDIGAIELQGAPSLVVDIAADEEDGNHNPGDLSLREAIGIANAHPGVDRIIFAPGLRGQTLTLNSELLFSDGSGDTEIAGPGADLLFLDGNDATRVFNVAPNAFAIISGLTIQNSLSDGGSAIRNAGVLTVANSELRGNHSSLDGGAIYSTGALTVRGSTFTNNSAEFSAGALGVYGGTATIENSTFSGNFANFFGGGIDVNGASATFLNSTIVANRARATDGEAGTGGGISNFGFVTLHNTIVAGNLRGAVNALPDDLGNDPVQAASSFNLIGNAGSSGGLQNGISGNLVGQGGTGTRPLTSIVDPTLNANGGRTKTHALTPGSVAINAGDNAGIPGDAVDQRGAPFVRIAGGTVDLGAVERQTIAPTSELVSSVSTSFFGESVDFTVTVGGAGTNLLPTGMVTFFSEGGLLGAPQFLVDGAATISVADLPVGTHVISALYQGDANFGVSNTLLVPNLTVDKGDTSVFLDSTSEPSLVGQEVTFTAVVFLHVGDGLATGTITFSIDGTALDPVALVNGLATFATSALEAGSHTITATYSGDANFNPSGDSRTQTVTSQQLLLEPSGEFRENQQGAVVGTLLVNSPTGAGEGEGGTFTFSVSDERFEVVNGDLKLKNNQSVSAGDVITLTVTAVDTLNPANTLTLDLELTAIANPNAWQNPNQKEDADANGLRNIDDVLFIIRVLRARLGGPVSAVRPTTESGGNYGDVDGDHDIDIADALATITFLRIQRASGGEGEATPTASASTAAPTSAWEFALAAISSELTAKKRQPTG